MKHIKLLLSILIVCGLIISFGQNFTRAQTEEDAGVTIDLGGDDDKIELGLFNPTNVTNLVSFGVLRLVSFIAMLILVWIFIYSIFNLIKFAYKYINGESKDIGDGLKGAEGTMRAVGFSLAMVVAYGIMGLALGIGNPLRWPNKLAQCGDGEFLFRAEYRAQTVNTEIFEDDVLVYCCRKFTGVLEEYERERSISVGGHEDDGAVVGTPEKGGWMFISDPNSNKYPSALPVNVTGAEGCSVFTI